MKRILLLAIISFFTFHFSVSHAQCAYALKQYAERYPAAEPQDLYKLVFQDLYGPGHLITDSTACAHYVGKEVSEMSDTTNFPLYEYTLCDSNYVRVNLIVVRKGIVSLGQMVSAVMRSVGPITPDPRFVQSHSAAFKAAYDPHYRIVSRAIFEREFLPLFNTAPSR